MQILGFDPSLTNFGWALHDTEGVGSSRCLDRGRFQTSAKTLFVDRYIDLRGRVENLIQKLGVTRLGVEYPVFHNLYSEGMYGLFLYTCEAMKKSQIDVVFFSPGQIKAHARALPVVTTDPKTGKPITTPFRPGKWKMEKPDMVEAAKWDNGRKGVWDHNEADAYWVAFTAGRFWKYYDSLIDNFDGKSSTVETLTPLERKQFTAIHTYQRGKKAGTTVESGILYREDERFFLWSKE